MLFLHLVSFACPVFNCTNKNINITRVLAMLYCLKDSTT